MNEAISTNVKRSSADFGGSVLCLVSILLTEDNNRIGAVLLPSKESRLAVSDNGAKVRGWHEARALELESVKYPDGSHYVRVTQIAFPQFVFFPPIQSALELDDSIEVGATT